MKAGPWGDRTLLLLAASTLWGIGGVAAAQPPAEQPPPTEEPVPEPPAGTPPATEEPSLVETEGAEGAEPAVNVDSDEEEEEDTGPRIFDTHLYGYIEAFWEKDAPTPAGIDPVTGETVTEDNPHEFDIPNFVIMVQGEIMERFRYFLNLVAPGSGSTTEDEFVGVRNAWVEMPIILDYLNIRAGKTYRPFGLYNEILDAVPTFIGIEPPEIFDKDHLMLTRTTNLMVHGTGTFGDNSLHYSVTTGNDERAGDEVPLGADVHFDVGSLLRLGTSFYWSGGNAVPAIAVGEGSPRGGVANWMASDEYVVFGGYAQLTHEALTLQAEYWQAEHDAIRDPASVMLIAGNLNPTQSQRFFVNGDPAMGVITGARYTVRTFYVRAGYEIPIGDMALVPYVQLDYYENPEIIDDKDLGGDHEAGLSDDGIFWKPTIGAVFRPVPPIALKIDGSVHVQQYNQSTFVYPEIRISLSFQWELELPSF